MYGREQFGLKFRVVEKTLAYIKKNDMNNAPQSGRLIRPRLAGFEVISDMSETNLRATWRQIHSFDE
jgi:hypothetical protein